MILYAHFRCTTISIIQCGHCESLAVILQLNDYSRHICAMTEDVSIANQTVQRRIKATSVSSCRIVEVVELTLHVQNNDVAASPL
jgi:hypothetical protein